MTWWGWTLWLFTWGVWLLTTRLERRLEERRRALVDLLVGLREVRGPAGRPLLLGPFYPSRPSPN